MARKEKIQIGKYEVEAFLNEDPIDGFKYTVEAEGQSADRYRQVFFPPKLQGLKGRSFPEGVDLSIYNVRRGFRHVQSIWIRKLDGICTAMNLIMLDFHLWDMPESLGSFVDRYVLGLRAAQDVSEVSSSKSEYGFEIWSTTRIADNDDIYSRISKLEEIQESVFRRLLIPVDPSSSRKYGEERRHWWIRYVVVPLVGSGAVAAVLAKFLLQ